MRRIFLCALLLALTTSITVPVWASFGPAGEKMVGDYGSCRVAKNLPVKKDEPVAFTKKMDPTNAAVSTKQYSPAQTGVVDKVARANAAEAMKIAKEANERSKEDRGLIYGLSVAIWGVKADSDENAEATAKGVVQFSDELNQVKENDTIQDKEIARGWWFIFGLIIAFAGLLIACFVTSRRAKPTTMRAMGGDDD